MRWESCAVAFGESLDIRDGNPVIPALPAALWQGYDSGTIGAIVPI